MNEALTLDEALDMIDYQKDVIADMAGHNAANIRGFTRNESRLFRCLQAASGRFVPVGGLMSALYFDHPNEPSAGIIPVVICHLRAKLRRADCAVAAHIENLWGVGFRLVSHG